MNVLQVGEGDGDKGEEGEEGGWGGGRAGDGEGAFSGGKGGSGGGDGDADGGGEGEREGGGGERGLGGSGRGEGWEGGDGGDGGESHFTENLNPVSQYGSHLKYLVSPNAAERRSALIGITVPRGMLGVSGPFIWGDSQSVPVFSWILCASIHVKVTSLTVSSVSHKS